VESGWIPIAVIGAGPKFGRVIGPKAGDPQKLDGDQMSIEFEHGDANTPIARHRLASDQDIPPKVETGEHATISQFNHSVLWKKDGSIAVSTNDKDVAQQNKNTNPVISHSATSVQNNNTINHTTTLDPVKQTLANQSAVTDQNNNVKVSHSGVFDLIKKTLSHSSTDGSTTLSTVFDLSKKTLSHSATDGGSNTHSSVLDIVKGILHSSTKDIIHTATNAITRSAQTITDNGQSIVHNGNTSVVGNHSVTGILSAATAAFGTHSLNIAADGSFSGTAGGNVSGGFGADTLTATKTVNLPVYTIAGLASISAPAIGMLVYVSDTVSNATAAFNGIPTGGGSTTVKRSVTFDGASWRY
jgi:hypothetical protein